MRSRVMILMAILLFSFSAFADIAPQKKPESNKSIDTTLDIRLDRNAKEAKLIIPRSQMNKLLAEAGQTGDDATAAAAFNSTQTIISGILLSLALVFGGLWFANSGRGASKITKAAASVSIVAVSGFAAAIVFANSPPPPLETRSITGRTFAPAVQRNGGGWGKIKLEVSDERTRPQLIVPNPQSAASGEE